MRLLLASEFPKIFDRAKPFFPNKKFGHVLIINTASIGEGFDLDYFSEIEPFENIGYSVSLCDLASENNLDGKIKNADICYVAGGNTFYLLEKAQKSDFRKILSDRFLDGDFLYIGSSAGSILMSPDIDFISPMDDKNKAELVSTEGLKFIKFSFLPHVGHATMGQAASEIINNYNSNVDLMSFNDDQAIYVDDNKIEIL